MNIDAAIRAECHKLIHRQQRAVARSNAHRRRYEKVTGSQGGPSNLLPPVWSVSPAFNPYKVRRKARLVASSIEHRLLGGKYRPLPALVREIKKPDGGERPLSIFPVADAALGTLCFRRIAKRNQHRLSPFSYAFRYDIGVHEAVESIWRELRMRNRYWVVEFDFAKYFDTIDHDYLLRTMSKFFKVTSTELGIVRSLLGSRRAFGSKRYRLGEFVQLRRGIPQGNSLSLFLANVACHELDLALSRTPAIFARYADDILLLCETSAQADEVAELVLEHCHGARLAVNFRKSDGISRFGPEWAGPPSTPVGAGGKAKVDYLGYSFAYVPIHRRGAPASDVARRLSIRAGSLRKIRMRVSNIIYCHLLRYPQRKQYRPSRVDDAARIDWDLVTCINDLRDYIYGGIPEPELRSALADRSVRLHLNRSVIAFWPLTNDVAQLRQLDGWLMNSLASALSRRAQLLENEFGVQNYPALSKGELLAGAWYDETKVPLRSSETGETIKNDVRVPSFVRAWKYNQRCLLAFNLARFPFTGPES